MPVAAGQEAPMQGAVQWVDRSSAYRGRCVAAIAFPGSDGCHTDPRQPCNSFPILELSPGLTSGINQPSEADSPRRPYTIICFAMPAETFSEEKPWHSGRYRHYHNHRRVVAHPAAARRCHRHREARIPQPRSHRPSPPSVRKSQHAGAASSSPTFSF